MSIDSPRSPAEASDRLVNLAAAGAGIAAIIYSANVVEGFVSEAVADFVGYGQIAMGLIILLAYLPALLYLKSRGGRGTGKHYTAGFFNTIMRKAIVNAFNLTIGFLIILSILSRTVLSHFTAESMVDLMIAFALATFSISFFVISRFSDEAGKEE
ncbi:MAG: hypothetical protein RIB03_07750 [Henriciella sp.]|uniref:hypothetical protein n=1 Tax=Henriciella sp. TaxID=1968823 RepID=UPI0032EC756C